MSENDNVIRMPAREALFRHFVQHYDAGQEKQRAEGLVKETQDGLRHWAQLLASPLAKATLHPQSTREAFLAALPVDVQTHSQEVLATIPLEAQEKSVSAEGKLR